MDLDKFERERFNETIYKIFKRVHKKLVETFQIEHHMTSSLK